MVQFLKISLDANMYQQVGLQSVSACVSVHLNWFCEMEAQLKIHANAQSSKTPDQHQ